MVESSPHNKQVPSGPANGLDGATQPLGSQATAPLGAGAGAAPGGGKPGVGNAGAGKAGAGKAAGSASGVTPGAGKAGTGKAAGSVAGSASGPAKSGSLSGGLSGDVAGAGDSVASRRAAHGLSPETTNKTDAAELRRLEKEASAEDRKRKFQRQHRAKVVRRTIIAVVVVLVIGVVLGFWLLRWGLHDDAASIQGSWRVQGTDTVIDITEDKIVLTDEVAYDYVLDPEAKTLTFTFGGLSGNGRYRFSLDHSQLAIDDGEFDWGATLLADIPWTFEALAQKLVGNPEKSPELESGNMVLERM